MRGSMNTKQWGSCNFTQLKSPIHILSFTLLVPLLKPWTSYDDSSVSTKLMIQILNQSNMQKACIVTLLFLVLTTPAAGAFFFSICFSFLQFCLNTFFFSHSIIIILPVKHITTIPSPLTLVFLHVGKIPYLSEDKTIANVLSFMCYCIWAYRKERL